MSTNRIEPVEIEPVEVGDVVIAVRPTLVRATLGGYPTWQSKWTEVDTKTPLRVTKISTDGPGFGMVTLQAENGREFYRKCYSLRPIRSITSFRKITTLELLALCAED